MGRVQLNELTAFAAVAEHRSFTKAAARLGISKPSMSLTINALEQRLGVRLFNRTTRNVALTVAGEGLLAQIQPILEGIDQALDSVNSFRDKPIGTLRLAVARPVAMTSLASIVRPFLAEYPAIRLEVALDDTYSDIVSGHFDAGIRIGLRVERDMTVLRITDDFRVFVVAAPTYLEHHASPCIQRICMPTIVFGTAYLGMVLFQLGFLRRALRKPRSRWRDRLRSLILIYC
jgi:DNA-binding transcriptional LysR family regulator